MAKRILIVEDNVDLHGMFRHALVLAGFDVVHAADGLAALRTIDNAPPDLVVLDLGLPTMSGVEVRQEMADRPHTRDILVIVITGRPLGVWYSRVKSIPSER